MKILIIQEKGRHLKNQNFREALNLHRALKRINVESIVWGLNYDNFSTPFSEISKDCDALILLENYEVNNWVPDLTAFKGLKLFWSIDSHCILDTHINTCNKHNIDVVLNAVYGHGDLFKRKSYYFPNAYPEDLIKPLPNVGKVNDVGFCGNWLNRSEWVNYIEGNGIPVKKDIFVIGDDMINAVNSYKIHFNRNISDDINFRTFETLGCETFLLTNYTPGLEKLFDIGYNIITYNDGLDLINKIKYYLKNEDERNEITKRSFKHVKENHTYDNRAHQLIEIIKNEIKVI
jgi:glycosyltransferase involved in cell wall biosynthesis